MNLYELIKSRRTIRKFMQKEIEEDKLLRFVDAARVAPSGANMQPLKYVVISSPQMREKIFPLVRWAAFLAPDYNPKEDERPVAYVAVFADTDIKKAGYEVDMGAAVENLILAALSEGVGACWMGAIDYDKISQLLKAGENMKLLCVVALGYSTENPDETEIMDGNTKYYIGQDGGLKVPKRSMDEIVIKKL